MSTIKTNAILDASGGNTTTINGTTPTAYNTMGKNRIINGAMEIDQRNAGASVTIDGDNKLTLDRWKSRCESNLFNSYSVQQSSTAPTGFVNSLLVTSLGAASIGSTHFASQEQRIEGLSMSDFGWGSASAVSVTFSFWVRSSLTGTFGGYIANSAQSRAYPYTYTINSANTWEQKSVTIAGDTSGTWLTTNGIGLRLGWNLGTGTSLSGTAGSWGSTNYYSATGSVNLIETSGATWYITGVQLEVGSVATEFERRPYGTELQLCQRYFETSYPYGTSFGSFQPGFASGTTSGGATGQVNGNSFKVTKRAVPTITLYNAVAGTSGGVYRVSDAANVSTTASYIGTTAIGYLTLGASSENGYYWHFTANAEL